MQFKTTMRYHLRPVRMVAIKKSINNKCWHGCREKGTLLHCLWACKLVEPLWITVWRFLKMLEIELPSDSAIPLLGIHTVESRIKRDKCTLVFIAALFTCLPAEEWIRNCGTYTQWDISQLLKKCIFIRSNEVDGTGAYYTEWSQSEWKTPIQYINTYIWNLERW